jgi:hypothetical protein
MRKLTIWVSLVAAIALVLSVVTPTDIEASTTGAAAAVVGTWSWFTGESVEIRADGTVRAAGGNTGVWRVEHDQGGPVYVINWNDGQYIDRLRLQGNRLDGSNQIGTHVWGERVHGGGGAQNIVGTWSWFTGESVEIRADGTVRAAGGNTGVWRVEHDQGGTVYVINWNNGQYIDRLRLQGNRLDGSNQIGTHVWGERVGGGGVPQSVVGRWTWFNGGEVELRADGTVWSAGSVRGAWRVEQNQGREVYVINWNNGQYIDRLVREGNRLEGRNQNGTRVWGEWAGR